MAPNRQLTEHIPDHLLPFIAKQDASLYTPMDHASWRFILKISRAFFSDHAHQKYLDGLKETGISTERIPLIEEMDERLRRFGWRAVPVSGFIPPAAFMEFQSLGILPIACEMRKLENLAYTPAPDIVHEAAGHAPIIADQEYSDYLRSYGEVARRAIFSNQDMDVYQAIYELSEIKENPKSSAAEIAACEKKLEEAVASVSYVSEATQLSRMAWWTTEYGLVGPIDSPKIYGAGLLSSVGESYHYLSEKVKKRPLTVDCIHTSYDITRPQPELFVTSDFQNLAQVLNEFAATMAYRRGGVEALNKAKRAKSVTTTVLETGVQISGVLKDYKTDAAGQPIFLAFDGPTQISVGDRELSGQGPGYHKQGFSTPVGPLKDGRTPADMSEPEFNGLGFSAFTAGTLKFKSGIELRGKLTARVPHPAPPAEHEGRLAIITFEDCTITYGKETLFQPEWGKFDLVCGTKVTSVFGGPADRPAYLAETGGFSQKPRNPKTNLTSDNKALNALYAEVRKLRESGKKGDVKGLADLAARLEKIDNTDWLLRVELMELAKAWGVSEDFTKQIGKRLVEVAKTSPEKAELIQRGLGAL